ncbi:MAG: hypothetical protein O2912_06665, partial [Proteobacteria bacterium]|nr:hypothetical protein [Pseudomonadota bacterium]
MHNFQRLLNQFLSLPVPNSPAAKPALEANGISFNSFLNAPSGLSTTVAAGGLLGVLLGEKKSRKVTKTALQSG